MVRKRRVVLRLDIDRLEERSLLSTASLPSGLSPSQLTQAYGLNAITLGYNGQAIAGNGAGQTIAIVVAYHDPYLATDLHTFDATYGISDPSLIQTDLAGSATNDGWAGEETLDVEYAHAVAPAAKLIVVEAASDDTTALLAAVNVARNVPGVDVVSMSWGGSEMANEAQYNAYFATPAGHAGITFIAASGDSTGTQWPASSPNVLSVGGTSLSINSDGGYGGETAWSGGGGGVSLYQAEPTYQYNVQHTGRRTTPDVAFSADPNNGVSVYTTTPSTGVGSWQVVGGTSLGTPAWAAIIAIVDEGLALQGQGSLDGATQTIPALYSLPGSAFNTPSSVTTGRLFGGYAQSSVTTTGLGSPDGPALISALVASKGEATTAGTTGLTTTTPTTTVPLGTTTTPAPTPTAPVTAPTGGGLPNGGQPAGGGKNGHLPGGGSVPSWFDTWWWNVFGPGTGGLSRLNGTGSAGLLGLENGSFGWGARASAQGYSTASAPAASSSSVAPIPVSYTPSILGHADAAPFGLASSLSPTGPAMPLALQNAPMVLAAIEDILRERDFKFYLYN